MLGPGATKPQPKGSRVEKIIRIGAASAFRNDSRTGITQLLSHGEPPDYVIFDFLAESVMGGLGRDRSLGSGPGYAAEFLDEYLLPHLDVILDKGIKIIANAGGLDPAGCAAALQDKTPEQGRSARVGWVLGDDLTDHIDTIISEDTRDMFDGSSLVDKVSSADRVNSLAAYTGAFPIAALLGAGADIVVVGRAVDSALALGPLIHEFGWQPSDFDQLAAGTLVGHLIECSAQVTGGTFTDWEAVPDWAAMGMPIAECREDGRFVVTKPPMTGGLVSVGTVSEQMLYEVNDPQRYFVPDVVCDFSDVQLEQVGPDRVAVSGARGLGRTDTYKVSLTFDRGWRAVATLPIIGLDAAAKAQRTAAAVFERTAQVLRDSQLPPFLRTHCDVIGSEAPGPQKVLCRMVADHPTREGAQLLVREQGSAISHMAVGTSLGVGQTIRPLLHTASFLLNKQHVPLTAYLDGAVVDVPNSPELIDIGLSAPTPTWPTPPSPVDQTVSVPLIQLAWARSGDKGNLFNVAVIARDPQFLPWIAAALHPEKVGALYAAWLNADQPFTVDAYHAPGLAALNFVVHDSLDGGMLASPALDPAAKSMAQLLLHHPIQVSQMMYRELVTD